MDQQVYQKNFSEDNGNFYFFETESGKKRGLLQDRIVIDEQNRHSLPIFSKSVFTGQNWGASKQEMQEHWGEGCQRMQTRVQNLPNCKENLDKVEVMQEESEYTEQILAMKDQIKKPLSQNQYEIKVQLEAFASQSEEENSMIADIEEDVRVSKQNEERQYSKNEVSSSFLLLESIESNQSDQQSSKLNCQIVEKQGHGFRRPSLSNSICKYSDRFIPQRVSESLYKLKQGQTEEPEVKGDILTQKSNGQVNLKKKGKMYTNLLENSILMSQNRYFRLGENNPFLTPTQKKLLSFTSKSISEFSLPQNHIQEQSQEHIRRINKHPFKVLEAHKLQDDFYLNLLDWSPLNYLVVGLQDQVVLWQGCSSTISSICKMQNTEVSSVSCSPRSNHVAVGDSLGNVSVYDIAHKSKPFLTIKGHLSRVGSIAWNSSLIASGSRDRTILVRDLRQPQSAVQTYQGHKQEICGLKWSFDDNILASGGNDNKLFLWTLQSKNELAKFSEHSAAVKALGFSPHQHNLLASGGGTADRCIRFWNTQTLKQIDYLDSGSQVCNLMFSRNVNEIVTTHGYSLNQIILWKYPSMKKIQTLTGHTQRVLYLAMSPCGQNIVTGAGDESLRFWSLFPSLHNKSNILATSSLLPSCMDLR